MTHVHVHGNDEKEKKTVPHDQKLRLDRTRGLIVNKCKGGDLSFRQIVI